MIWDWSAKKKLSDEAEVKSLCGVPSDEQLEEGTTLPHRPEYGYHKSSAEVGNNVGVVRQQAFNSDYVSQNVAAFDNASKTQNVTNSDKAADNKALSKGNESEKSDVWNADDIIASISDIAERKSQGKMKTKTGFSVSGQKFSSATVVEVDDDSSMWEWQLSLFNLPGMDLVEAQYTPLDANTRLELRRNFRRIRRDFLRYIAYYNQPELEEAGVEDKGLRSLKKGKAPENYDVHLKIPYEYGGKNEFANMLFIQTHPFSEDIHKFLDMQITSQPFGCRLSRLYIPVAQGRVYIPQDSVTIGGGKGMGDKTSVQGFSAAALQQIAVKSTMDRGAGI